MTVTTTHLTRAAGISAVAAGALFIGVQIGHPHLDTTSITTTDVAVRTAVKVMMTALALAGFAGMYLSQVRRNGIVGLVGYLLLSAGYLFIMCTTFATGFVLPSVVDSDPSYVADVIEAASGGTAAGDIGAMGTVLQIQGVLYLVGGLVFGVALFRAGVLARWAAVLLAVGGLASVVLSYMPDAFYRMLAFPNAVAMIALGWSLWSTARTSTSTQPAAVTAGATR